jgi:glycosyl hydrolase family 1
MTQSAADAGTRRPRLDRRHRPSRVPSGARPGRRSLRGMGPRRGRLLRRGALPYVLLLPALFCELIVHLVPMVVGAMMSFRELTLFYIRDWAGAPWVGLHNYRLAVDVNAPLGRALLHSFLVTVAFTVLAVGLSWFLGTMTAVLMQDGFRGRGALRAIFLVPYALPVYAAVMTWSFMFQRDTGLVNHVLADQLHVIGDKPFWLIGDNSFWALLTAAVRASCHLHLAHGLGAQAIRANAAGAHVGIVNIHSPCDPASDRDEDVAAARRADGHLNRWWLDPIHGRGYPADMTKLYGVDLPLRDGDLRTIAQPLDWLGVNYYFRQVVTADAEAQTPYIRQIDPPGASNTAMDWEVHPDGLERTLVRVAADYAPRRILVTENGSAYADTVTADGAVHDAERIAYLESHLDACGRSVRRGVPLAGYFAWSLLDNFEWAYGYDKRFGLVHVDYATQTRTVKDSGYRYAEIIRAHRRHHPAPVDA